MNADNAANVEALRIAFPSDLFRFPIGTEFLPVGKRSTLHRVTITETGEIVRTYYRCEHAFCGQLVESDENETTIARGVAE